jgi:hypothetical protein
MKFIEQFLSLSLLIGLMALPFSWPGSAETASFEVLNLASPQKSFAGDSVVTVVRFSPKPYKIRLLCASEFGKGKRTAKKWCEEFGLLAGINASMFRQDGLTSTGFMKNYKHFNNSKRNPDYNSCLVFNPSRPDLPDIRMLDLQRDDFAAIEPQYHSVVQNLRMISFKRENVWSQQPRKWSMVSLGVDGRGNILFMFTRSPHSVHDFINILLGLDIDIQQAMYLEGGPEASIYIKTADKELSLFGSYETGFNENDNNDRFWPIPNVIGVSLR